MTVSRLHTEKAGGRLCASDYHLGKRQNNSYQNSVYRTQNKYSEKSTNKYEKFCPADLPQSLCQMKLRGTHERWYDNRREHRNRQISYKACAKKKHCYHGNACNKPCELCLTLVLLAHRSSWHWTVYRTAARKSRSHISYGKCQKLRVIIYSVSVFLCEIVFCQKCLCHDDNSNRKT